MGVSDVIRDERSRLNMIRDMAAAGNKKILLNLGEVSYIDSSGIGELVSGFNTEYSGVKFAFFFLGEYTAMIVISCVAVTVFLGGWLQPFPNVAGLKFLGIVPPVVWFLGKVGAFIFCYIWFRSTFPRYRRGPTQ